MKLCTKCIASPLPFVMITLLAGVIGFITWLMLGLSDWGPSPRIAAGLGSGIAVAATLWHYVVDCMRRHCRHHRQLQRTLPSSHY
jgi:hypothetical protein